MSEPNSLLACYTGWATYQRMLSNVVKPLTQVQLSLQVTSARWTVGRTVQHLIANRVWWFREWMGEGDAALAPLAGWDPGIPGDITSRTGGELVQALDATWRMIETALAKWTMADLAQSFAPPASMSPEEREMFGSTTRQWIIWHVFEHEIHHGGQISLVLGQHGLEGIYGNM